MPACAWRRGLPAGRAALNSSNIVPLRLCLLPADAAEIMAAAGAGSQAAAAGKARAAGRMAEQQEDRGEVVKRRRKQRLQVGGSKRTTREGPTSLPPLKHTCHRWLSPTCLAGPPPLWQHRLHALCA